MAIDLEQLVASLRSIGNSVSYQLGDNNPENQAADLIEAFDSLLGAAEIEHGSDDFEAECPICVAVRRVNHLLEKGNGHT